MVEITKVQLKLAVRDERFRKVARYATGLDVLEEPNSQNEFESVTEVLFTEFFDEVVDAFINEAPIYGKLYAKGSVGSYPIDIKGFGGVYLYWAPEFGHKGMFDGLEAALDAVRLNWSDSLTRYRSYREAFELSAIASNFCVREMLAENDRAWTDQDWDRLLHPRYSGSKGFRRPALPSETHLIAQLFIKWCLSEQKDNSVLSWFLSKPEELLNAVLGINNGIKYLEIAAEHCLREYVEVASKKSDSRFGPANLSFNSELMSKRDRFELLAKFFKLPASLDHPQTS